MPLPTKLDLENMKQDIDDLANVVNAVENTDVQTRLGKVHKSLTGRMAELQTKLDTKDAEGQAALATAKDKLTRYAAINYTGDFVAATAYEANDVWKNTADGSLWIVPADYTSGANAQADIDAKSVRPHQDRDRIESVDTMADLRLVGNRYAGKKISVGGHTVVGFGGGEYIWNAGDFTEEISLDDGGVYIASADDISGSVGCWVKSDTKSVSPYDFGAFPQVPYQQDLLQKAINVAAFIGSKLDWELPKNYEWLTFGPIYIKSLSNWTGSGRLRNTNPAGDINSTTLMPGGFNPVYFGPTNPSVTGYTFYELNSVGASKDISLTNSANAEFFPVGTLVWVVTNISWLGTSGDYPVFALLASVESCDLETGELILDSPIKENISLKYGDARICNAQDDNVTDLLGNKLEFCIGSDVNGLSVISDHGSAFSRGGMYNCNFKFKRIEAKNAVFANAFVKTKFEVDAVYVSRKLCDVAGFSQDFEINILSSSYKFIQGQSESISFCRVGECSRDGVVNVLNCDANEFEFGEALGQIDSGCHRVKMNMPNAHSESHTGSPFKLNQSITSGSQISLEECEINGKATVGSLCSRGAWMNSLPGKEYMIKCGFGSVSVSSSSGFSTGYAIEFNGVESYCNEAKFYSGVARIPPGIVGTRVRGYFEDGVSIVESENDVLVTSGSGFLSKIGVSRSTTVENITSTDVDNLVNSALFPGGSLSPGDRYRIKIRGEVVGTSDAKTITFCDDDTTFFIFSLSAGDIGNFTLDIDVIVQGEDRYTAFAIFNLIGVTTLSDSVDSSEDLSVDTNFRLNAWVGNASDIIRFHCIDSDIDKMNH